MKSLSMMVVAAVVTSASVCQAQLTFSGPAALSGAFTSATLSPAPVITITSPASGINLTGDFYVTTSGPTAGNMLSWAVDRPISGGTAPFNITTIYTGFISVTGGINNPTGGTLTSAIYNGGSLVAGTTCVVQFNQAGPFTPISASNTVTVSSYTYAAGDTLRLAYFADINYVGIGDVYDLNFPAETLISEIPEPASLGLLGFGIAGLMLRRRSAMPSSGADARR